MSLLSYARMQTIVVSICITICINASFAWCANELREKHEQPELFNQNIDETAMGNVTKMLEELRFSKEESAIYKKWNEHLESISHFNNQEYMSTALKLGIDFAASVKNLEKCIELKQEKEKRYSSVWLNDLHKKYGREYILKNRKSISFILLSILCYYQSGECVEARKDAIYRESSYTYILHRYIKYYLDYVVTLDKEEQNIIKRKSDYAKSILEISGGPLKELIASGTVLDALQMTALNSRKDFDPELREYLTQHPSFQGLFDFNKALMDLREYK